MQVARPLTEVDDALRQLLVVLVAARRGRRRARGGARRPRRPRRRWRRSRRFTRRTEAIADDPDLTTASRSTATTSWPGSPQLQRGAGALEAPSTRSGTWWPTPATSCARRSRACARTSRSSSDADKLPPDERDALRDDIIAELDELTALVGDIVELARGTSPSGRLDDVRLDRVVAAWSPASSAGPAHA